MNNAGGQHQRKKGWHNFRYAFEGWRYAWRHEPHMKLHSFFTLIAIVAAIVLQVSRIELLFVLLACTLVLVTELVNTAVERAVDVAQPNMDPLAKIAKDAAAGAVLMSSVFAILVGLLIFLPIVWHWLDRIY